MLTQQDILEDFFAWYLEAKEMGEMPQFLTDLYEEHAPRPPVQLDVSWNDTLREFLKRIRESNLRTRYNYVTQASVFDKGPVDNIISSMKFEGYPTAFFDSFEAKLVEWNSVHYDTINASHFTRIIFTLIQRDNLTGV